MKAVSIRFAIGLFALSLAAPAMADPSGTISKLMNEPVSLFSYGLNRLSDDLNSFAHDILKGSEVKNAFAHTTFDWATSHINLYVTILLENDEEPERLERRCEQTIDLVRPRGGIRSDGIRLSLPLGFRVKVLPDRLQTEGDNEVRRAVP